MMGPVEKGTDVSGDGAGGVLSRDVGVWVLLHLVLGGQPQKCTRPCHGTVSRASAWPPWIVQFLSIDRQAVCAIEVAAAKRSVFSLDLSFRKRGATHKVLGSCRSQLSMRPTPHMERRNVQVKDRARTTPRPQDHLELHDKCSNHIIVLHDSNLPL